MGHKSCLGIIVIILAEVVQLGIFYYTTNITVSNIIGVIVMLLWMVAICVMLFSMFKNVKSKLWFILPVAIVASVALSILITSMK